MSNANRKSIQIMFSMSPDVRDMLVRQAKDAGLTRSGYLSRLILQREYEHDHKHTVSSSGKQIGGV